MGGFSTFLYAEKHGIKQNKSIYKHIPNWRVRFGGTVIGIDMSLLVYQIIKVASTAREVLLGNYTTTVRAVNTNMRALRAANITPFAVFDGRDQGAKAPEQAKRKKENEDGAAEIMAGSASAASVIKAVRFTEDLQTEIVKLMNEMCIEYIVAPYQADPQLVWLSTEKKVDYIWSTDTDMLAHGATRLIVNWDWNFPNDACPERGAACLITSDDLFGHRTSEMEVIFNDHGLIALVLLALCKCDYFDLKGVGVVGWITIMKEIGSETATAELFVATLLKTLGNAHFRSDQLREQ